MPVCYYDIQVNLFIHLLIYYYDDLSVPFRVPKDTDKSQNVYNNNKNVKNANKKGIKNKTNLEFPTRVKTH